MLFTAAKTSDFDIRYNGRQISATRIKILPGRYRILIEALIPVFRIDGIDNLNPAKNDLKGSSGNRVMTNNNPIRA